MGRISSGTMEAGGLGHGPCDLPDSLGVAGSGDKRVIRIYPAAVDEGRRVQVLVIPLSAG